VARLILYPFLAVSLAGFIVSAAVQILSVIGLDIPFPRLIFILHIGAMAMWIPAVITARFTRVKGAANEQYWSALLRGCPPWMLKALYILIVYVFVNFVFFFVYVMFRPADMGVNHVPPIVFRGTSGHWLLFYYLSFAVMYSAVRIWRREDGKGDLTSPEKPDAPFTGVS